MGSVIFSNEEARFLRLVLRLVDRPVPDLDDDQASTLLESLIAAGLHRHSRPRDLDKEKEQVDDAIRVLVIGERKAGKDGLWSQLSTCSTSSAPGLSPHVQQPTPHGSLHGCRQTMTIPTRHHTIDIFELSPDCLQVQPVPASPDQETNVSTLFAAEQQQQQQQQQPQMTTVSETEAEHLAQALAITEAAILVYDTSDEASLVYLQSLAGMLDRAVELHQQVQSQQQQKKSSVGSEQGINGAPINNDQTKNPKKSPTRNELKRVGTLRRSAWPSLKRGPSARNAERTQSKESSSSASPSPSSPTTPSPPDQAPDAPPPAPEAQKYHFLLLGVKPGDPAEAESNALSRSPRSREYERASTSSAPGVNFLEISSSSRAEWTAALDMLGTKVVNSGRYCSRSRQYQHGQEHQNGHIVIEDTTVASVHNGIATGEVSGGQCQGPGAQKHHQTQKKVQRHKLAKGHTQTQPALGSLESMALTLFSTPSSKLNNTSRHPRLSHHQKSKRTFARSRWGLLKSVLSVGSILRADVSRKKTAQRQLAGAN